YARDPLAGAVAVVRALAGGVEGLPGNADGVVDPGFFRFRVAAGGLPLLDDLAAGFVQPRIDLGELVAVLDLDAEMIESGRTPARGDREIDARVVEHPLGVVALDDGRRAREQRRIEADRSLQVVDGNVHMHPLHRITSRVRREAYLFSRNA